MFEAVIFDFGGVLTTPLQESFARFAEEIEVDLGDLVRIMLRAYAGGEDSLVTDFETGRIDEQEFSVEFARRIGELAGREIEHDGIVGRLFGGMSLEPDMIELVRDLRRRGLKTGLLSNSWGLSGYPRDLLAELFEVTVISGEVGLRKPDPQIFKLTADRLGVAPDRCVFVDDHPGHLQAALEEGMRTVLHRTPAETIAEVGSLLGEQLQR